MKVIPTSRPPTRPKMVYFSEPGDAGPGIALGSAIAVAIVVLVVLVC